MKKKISQSDKDNFELLLKVTAKHVGVAVKKVLRPRGSIESGYVRHILWYLCKTWMPHLSNNDIAKMSRKTRPAVSMGIEKISAELRKPGENPTKQTILEITKKLRGA